MFDWVVVEFSTRSAVMFDHKIDLSLKSETKVHSAADERVVIAE